MTYRGQDLDLRVPGVRDPGAASAGMHYAEPPRAGRSEPLWVDEAVLACCNHAYDLALAHRAHEVRIEHLLNAMTRVDAAARVLEARGIRVASLRRDSASLIVAEAGVGIPNGRHPPKTSEPLDDVIRLAARQAASRQSPATINDVLTVLIDMKRDLPGYHMLRSHYEGWNLRDPMEPRYVPVEEPREWIRGPAPGYYVSAPPRPEPYAPMTDTVHNSRLDTLERALRDLTHTLGSERAAMSQWMADMQRMDMRRRDEPVMAPRPDLSGPSLAAIERNVDAKFSELARSWSMLGERLQSIEQSIAKSRAEPVGVPAGLVDRLKAFEGLDKRLAELDRTITVMADRMVGLERHLSDRPEAQVANLAPVLDRIAGLERNLSERIEGGSDISPLLERMQNLELAIETKPAVVSGDAGAFAQQFEARIRAIEEAVTAQRSGFAHFAASMGGEMRQLAASVKLAPVGGDGLKSLVADQLQVFTAGLDRQQSQISSNVSQPVLQRLAALSSQVESRQADSDRAFGAIAERLSSLERSLANWGQQNAEVGVTHERDIKEVHDALVRLNTNQTTLAQSMDQWRLDLTGDLGEISNRVKAAEAAAARPAQTLERMSQNMESLQNVAGRREESKSRFRHWLMGTDDWYGASWETNGAGRPSRPADPGTQARGGVRPPPVPSGRQDV